LQLAEIQQRVEVQQQYILLQPLIIRVGLQLQLIQRLLAQVETQQKAEVQPQLTLQVQCSTRLDQPQQHLIRLETHQRVEQQRFQLVKAQPLYIQLILFIQLQQRIILVQPQLQLIIQVKVHQQVELLIYQLAGQLLLLLVLADQLLLHFKQV
jgi:hypothetical protein